MKKVLFIENEEAMLAIWVEMLSFAGIETVCATNLTEAEQMFALGGYDAIVLDACLETTSTIDCLPLLANMKQTFIGPIIAASNEEYNRAMQMAYGCTHEAKGKHTVLPIVLATLGVEFALAA